MSPRTDTLFPAPTLCRSIRAAAQQVCRLADADQARQCRHLVASDELIVQRFRFQAAEHGEAMRRIADRDLLIRHARTRGRELRAGALLVELGTATVLQTRVGVLHCAELVLGIDLCDRKPPLPAATVEPGSP